MKIAINGAGIAGPTLAYWLERTGHEPVLIEKAPHVRSGGYIIDFWGVGYTIAERMGILSEVRKAGYSVQEVRVVDSHGRRAAGFSAKVFARLTNGRFTSLRRGDLASVIYRSVQDRVETIFGDSISRIEQNGPGVRVAFQHGAPRDFDLVIGADGLHSAVRDLAFGPQSQFEKQLGYRVAAFEVEGYRPRDELVYLSYTAPGRQVARFALRGDRTLFLFVFVAEHMTGAEPRDDDERKAALHRVFSDIGWECPQILKIMDRVEEVYFDRVSQIRMDAWSNGRVILVGDAAACVSLLAGEGTGLAMAEAYILAGELARAKGDHREAFRRYEQRLRPLIESKQKSAEDFAATFAPRTALGL
jgi:2-polyprenyl-6-methoxyphenol hydroxylase-like FAD-dependent oxidoreductase